MAHWCVNVQVDCIVTTAGGVEEDFIKCLAPTYIGDFHLSGCDLRDRGINRIGNLLAPNDNYCKFEDWIMPILDEMVTEQKEQVGFLLIRLILLIQLILITIPVLYMPPPI